MIKAVVENSAAGFAHPEDPSLRITQVAVVSSTGLPNPSEGSHAYTYDGNGNIATDTWTDRSGVVRVRTYVYNAMGQLVTKPDWVLQ